MLYSYHITGLKLHREFPSGLVYFIVLYNLEYYKILNSFATIKSMRIFVDWNTQQNSAGYQPWYSGWSDINIYVRYLNLCNMVLSKG